MRTSLLLLAVGLASVSSNQIHAADAEALKAELVRTETEFFKHALEHGFGPALRDYMAEDALIANTLVLGRDGQEARIKAEAGKARPNVLRWKPLRADVAASGDLGYTWGVAESGPTRDGPFKPYAIYVTVWKRQAGGKWKFVYDAATITSADAVEKFLRDKFPEVATPVHAK